MHELNSPLGLQIECCVGQILNLSREIDVERGVNSRWPSFETYRCKQKAAIQ